MRYEIEGKNFLQCLKLLTSVLSKRKENGVLIRLTELDLKIHILSEDEICFCLLKQNRCQMMSQIKDSTDDNVRDIIIDLKELHKVLGLATSLKDKLILTFGENAVHINLENKVDQYLNYFVNTKEIEFLDVDLTKTHALMSREIDINVFQNCLKKCEECKNVCVVLEIKDNELHIYGNENIESSRTVFKCSNKNRNKMSEKQVYSITKLKQMIKPTIKKTLILSIYEKLPLQLSYRWKSSLSLDILVAYCH